MLDPGDWDRGSVVSISADSRTGSEANRRERRTPNLSRSPSGPPPPSPPPPRPQLCSHHQAQHGNQDSLPHGGQRQRTVLFAAEPQHVPQRMTWPQPPSQVAGLPDGADTGFPRLASSMRDAASPPLQVALPSRSPAAHMPQPEQFPAPTIRAPAQNSIPSSAGAESAQAQAQAQAQPQPQPQPQPPPSPPAVESDPVVSAVMMDSAKRLQAPQHPPAHAALLEAPADAGPSIQPATQDTRAAQTEASASVLSPKAAAAAPGSSAPGTLTPPQNAPQLLAQPQVTPPAQPLLQATVQQLAAAKPPVPPLDVPPPDAGAPSRRPPPRQGFDSARIGARSARLTLKTCVVKVLWLCICSSMGLPGCHPAVQKQTSRLDTTSSTQWPSCPYRPDVCRPVALLPLCAALQANVHFVDPGF